MTIAVHDCPHCHASKVAFRYTAGANNGALWNGFANCPACSLPVAARFVFRAVVGFDSLSGNVLGEEYSNLLVSFSLYPAPPEVTAPDHLPENVAKAYTDAEKARLAGLYTPACATYRRVMELAMKQFSPDVEAWKLEQRIRTLHTNGLITQSLFDWANQLRLDGNEAIHGDAEADKELADQMQGLTEMLLIYLYTMPQRIAAMRGA